MIHVTDLTLQVGNFRLEDVSFEIPTGHYCVLMGKTGSGKTTVIEAIAGLAPILAGTIVLGDLDVTALRPQQRNIGYVPQDGALFATMTVSQHLAFALRIRRVESDEIKERVDELARLLEIQPLLKRTIHGLSGGERQRVALGRALSFRPTTLLLDEPLSALDDETHTQMCDLLESVQQQTGVTILHVSHREQEAERLAQSILRIEDGVFQLSQGYRPAPASDEEETDSPESVEPETSTSTTASEPG
ncbi:MAG: ABC transporter ATP-binding protein [Pirellulaceae bacterium]